VYLASAYLTCALEPQPQHPRSRPFGASFAPAPVQSAPVARREPKQLIVQPDAGVQPLLDALDKAAQRILLKQFELREPSILRAVIAAHKRGVACKVLLNPVRQDGTRCNDKSFRMLQKARVPCQWSRPRVMVSHEKSMIVDERAFICTFNFSPRFFAKSRGYAVVTTNPEEVQEIAAAFDADWNRRPFKPRKLLWSGGKSRQMIAELIDSARMTLDLQHPKLLDISILDRLLAAVERGVRVRFLSSGQKGVNLEDLLENAASFRILQRAGAHVHRLQRPKVHAKVVIVDGKLAQLGSMNLARHAFESRRELGILLREREILDGLQSVYESDWSQSEPWIPPDPITQPYLERGWDYAAPWYPGQDEGWAPPRG